MNNYNLIQKILHHLVLGNKFINKSLYELEKIFFDKKNNFIDNEHLFITGLPRSGTTILLNFFYRSKNFASLTYSDMPFVMSPNLIGKVFNRKDFEPLERIHNDGIKHNLDSPEAFDEIFFKVFENSAENLYNFQKFVGLVLKKYSKERYLSKNNKNYKRINFISSIFPNAKILITYRSPLQHAFSLLNQHRNFCILQTKDKFILDYMNYLGHHEFGLNYQSWNNPKKYNSPNSLNHWLEQWQMFYEQILENFNSSNSYLLGYEYLCENNEIIQKLKNKFNIKNNDALNLFKISQKKFEEDYDNELLNDCLELLKKLDNLNEI